jgi:EAL domain-containing protein (putative c-di-GMP-specific phosphodiesterase class I)
MERSRIGAGCRYSAVGEHGEPSPFAADRLRPALPDRRFLTATARRPPMSPPDQSPTARDDLLPQLQLSQAAPRDTERQVTGEFSGLTLQSVFQPIFSPAHCRAVGYEALVRAQGLSNQPVSPLELFKLPRNENEDFLLDCVCRSIHLSNFVAQQHQHGWLFLNVNPGAVLEGNRYTAFFRDLLAKNQFPANRVVIEILEGNARDEQVLARSIDYYRNLGCLIAIDDFGAGESNFERIWRFKPEIVKLDRSIIVQAATNPTVRRTLPSMVSLLHQSGCLVLAEGVQTEREAIIAMESDVDMVQGYYFARPDRLILEAGEYADHFTSLWSYFKAAWAGEREQQQVALADYVHAIDQAAAGLVRGKQVREAAWNFLELPRCDRVFVLDWQGKQSGQAIKALRLGPYDPRFEPLADAAGADWSRRSYFQTAIAHPNKVHASAPYLSASSPIQCITLSIAVLVNGETRVLCGDIQWGER